jgi:hypothetical protein
VSTTYTTCPAEVILFAQGVMTKYHPDLNEVGVTIDYLFAHNQKGDALTLRGQKCAAIVQVMKLADRVVGTSDARIRIDYEWWNEHDDPDREAMLDHEHEHLVFAKSHRDDKGYLVCKKDDIGRPLLKLKPHDLETGVFLSVVARHKDRSQEAKNAYLVAKEMKLRGATLFDNL